MNRLPLLTLLLCGLAGGLALLPPAAQAYLYYDYDNLLAGRWLGLLSGHWLHADSVHLAWNAGALLILGGLIERHSRPLLVWSILAGTVGVDLLLVSPVGGLTRYCGLSGILNTLLGVVLLLQWRHTRSMAVVLVAVLCALKIGVELSLGESLFTHISWPPYAPAHLAGLIAAPVALLAGYGNTVNDRTTRKATGALNEHLVTSA